MTIVWFDIAKTPSNPFLRNVLQPEPRALRAVSDGLTRGYGYEFTREIDNENDSAHIWSSGYTTVGPIEAQHYLNLNLALGREQKMARLNRQS